MMRTLVGLLLLQVGAGLRTGKDDHCGCLTWKDVYKNNRSSCGAALEFATMSQWKNGAEDGHLVDPNAGFPSTAQAFIDSKDNESASEMLKYNYCFKWFANIESNACVKVAPTNDESKWYGKSWCYVSAECQSLNGGARVNGISGQTLGAKICSSTEDTVLGDMSINDLTSWHRTSIKNQNSMEGVSFALTAKMSWPYMGENLNTISDKDLAAARAKEKPLLYDLTDQNSGKRLIVGSKAYILDYEKAICISNCGNAYAR